MARFEFYRDRAGKWRWRLWSGSRKVATSGENFASRSNAVRSAQNVSAIAGSAAFPGEGGRARLVRAYSRR
jgi:uncharacterized protein YegP (UPF0339 family)